MYSSFAYMIEIFSTVGDVMAVADSNTAPFDDVGGTNQKVAIADTKLANWDAQLLQSKRDPVRSNGKVDSLTFTAHLMRNW